MSYTRSGTAYPHEYSENSAACNSQDPEQNSTNRTVRDSESRNSPEQGSSGVPHEPDKDDLAAARGCAFAGLVSAALVAFIAAMVLAGCASTGAAGTPFAPERAIDGRIEVQDCLGGGLVEHLYDLERARDQGIEIELSGAVMSACTHALRYENVSWAERTTFCFHAVDRRGRIDRRETVAGWRRMPAGVQALLPDPETVGLAYTCIPGATVREALDRS